MSQCGCLKPNPAHGRWWVGSTSRSQHDMGMSSLGFPSSRSRRGLPSGSSADVRDNRGFRVLYLSHLRNAISSQTDWIPARRQRAGVQESISPLMGTPTAAVRGTKPYTRARRSSGRRRRTRVGALGEATSSQNQVMTYPCYVRISKPSPPTIYHGQGLA